MTPPMVSLVVGTKAVFEQIRAGGLLSGKPVRHRLLRAVAVDRGLGNHLTDCVMGEHWQRLRGGSTITLHDRDRSA